MKNEIVLEQQVTDHTQAEDWEELVSMGMEVRENHDQSRWILGDLADKVAVQYGKHSIEQYAITIFVQKTSLMRYRDVSRKISPHLREKHKMLSWTHFRTAAGQENPAYWLEKADDNGWSVENLATQIKKSKGEPVKPLPKVRLVECQYCHKWRIDGPKDLVCANYKDCSHVV